MSKEIELEPNAPCDNCGAIGSYDFCGDYICQNCLDNANLSVNVELADVSSEALPDQFTGVLFKNE